MNYLKIKYLNILNLFIITYNLNVIIKKEINYFINYTLFKLKY